MWIGESTKEDVLPKQKGIGRRNLLLLLHLMWLCQGAEEVEEEDGVKRTVCNNHTL